MLWSDPSRRLGSNLAIHTARSLPPARLVLCEADADAQPELVAFGIDGPEILEPDGAGGLALLGSALVPPPYEVEGATAAGVILSMESSLQSFGPDLVPQGGPVEVPTQGGPSWRAARLWAGGPALTIIDRVAFWEGGDPEGFALGGEVGFVQDLDGDGVVEIVSYANPGVEDAEGLRVRVYEWDADTETLGIRWELLAEDVPSLVGARTGSSIQWAPGDFDGEGSLDLAFSGYIDGVPHLLLLDGDTGTLDGILNPSAASSSLSPLRAEDLVDAAGQPGSDGIDDLLHVNPARLELLSQGHDAPLFEQGLQVYGSLSAWADLDGDGIDEFFVSVLGSLIPTGETLEMSAGVPAPYWGPVEMGPLTGLQDLLSFSALDGVAGLDLFYLNGDGSLTARAGTSGAMLPGYPLYLDGGTLLSAAPQGVDLPTSIVVLDVDDDGFEEAVVGTRRGWIYALDVAPDEVGAPSLLWSIQVPAGVASLGASDVEGDEHSELIVSAGDGSLLVLGGDGASLEITAPTSTDCHGEATIDVSGTASGMTTVDLFANGVPSEAGIDASSGSWSGAVVLSAAGTWSVRADGFDAEGILRAVAFREIVFEGDPDGDGTTECGGDCAPNDASRGPGIVEVCGDGVDQDCDGIDAACDDDDDSASDDDDDDDDSAGDDDDSTPDPTAPTCGCGCDCDAEASAGAGSSGLALLLPIVAWRRRR